MYLGKRGNKKGQVTLFIIVGLLIVGTAILLLYFLDQRDIINITAESTENPLQYMESCIKDPLEDNIDTIMSQGGEINPTLYEQYKGNNIAYTCYTAKYYERCTNQKPLLIKSVSEEIKESIITTINTCFSSMKNDLERKNIQVDGITEVNNEEINVEVIDKKILLRINKEITTTDKEEINNYKEFLISINSPLYKLLRFAGEITNQEANFCHSAYGGMMLLYPSTEITKKYSRGEVIIYSIKDEMTKKQLNIAIRACAMPRTI